MFSKSYPLKRKKASGYFDASGNYIEAPTDSSITFILADCQPLNSKELETLNIGQDSNKGKIKVYTDEELLITVKGTDGNYLQQGDIITFDGKDYEMISKDKHQNNLINHNKYIAELKD
jgi:hypothetical protein